MIWVEVWVAGTIVWAVVSTLMFWACHMDCSGAHNPLRRLEARKTRRVAARFLLATPAWPVVVVVLAGRVLRFVVRSATEELA